MKKRECIILVLLIMLLTVAITGFSSKSSSMKKTPKEIKKEIDEKNEEVVENIPRQEDVDRQVGKADTHNLDKKNNSYIDTKKIADNFIRGKVTKHIDGDTVHVTTDNGDILKIRMIGINTPETVHPTKDVEFYGKEASDFTKKNIYNKIIYLEKDVSDVDRYGRSLRYIWLSLPNKIDQENIVTNMLNAQLVINGYANASTYPPDIKYQEYFTKFEIEARENNIGLWDETKLDEFEKERIELEESYSKTLKVYDDKGHDIIDENYDTAKKYVANMNTKKFHDVLCTHVKKISEFNKLFCDLREELIENGYVPCKICKP